MMVRIAIIGSLLVILTGAAIVAVIFLNRPDGAPGPPRPREFVAEEPARPTPALPLPDPARDMPPPPEPVVREPLDPVAPVAGFTPPPAQPAPPVPPRKPPAPMTAEPDLPARQPEAPIARDEPPVSDRADRDQASPTGGYQRWTPAADATAPAAIDPPPEPSRIGDATGTPEVARYEPWTSPPEPNIGDPSVPPATPEPARPDLPVARPPLQPDTPPAPEPASPIVTAALPPPAADTGEAPQVSRYEPWTPSGRDAPDDADKPRTPGANLLASINPTLARIPCAVLTASVEGGTVSLWGAVRNRPDLQQVKSTLMNLRAVTGVRTTVRQMSRAQCELVNLFSPYVAANRALDQRISVRAHTPAAEYEEYDNLVLDLGSPGRDGYVYVDYYALDGSVVHLIPSTALPTNRMRANTVRRLGDSPANGEWVIGKPLGVEMIVALSSPTPLFTARREEVESAAIYLRDLQASLERAPDGPAGQVVADIVFIKTVPIR